jgi:hypothetical protein
MIFLVRRTAAPRIRGVAPFALCVVVNVHPWHGGNAIS